MYVFGVDVPVMEVVFLLSILQVILIAISVIMLVLTYHYQSKMKEMYEELITGRKKQASS